MTFKVLSENIWQNSVADRIFLQKIKQNAAPFNFQVEFEYYDFSGITYNDAMKDMDIEAAKAINKKTDSGEVAVGIVKTTQPTSNFKSFRYVVNKKIITAYPVGITVQWGAKVILPQFKGLTVSGDLEKIRKTVREIIKHEQGHVCLALEAFNKVKQAALGFSGTGKTKLEAGKNLNAKIKPTFDSIFADFEIKNKKYDKETDHGRVEIEQEKYNKTFTSECDKYFEGV